MKKMLILLAVATIPTTLGGCAACCPPAGVGRPGICAALCPCCPFARPAPVVPVAPAPVCPPAPGFATPLAAAVPATPACAVWDPCGVLAHQQQPILPPQPICPPPPAVFPPAAVCPPLPQQTFPQALVGVPQPMPGFQQPFPAFPQAVPGMPQPPFAQPTRLAEPDCGIAYVEPACCGPMMGSPHGMVGYGSTGPMEYVVWPGNGMPNGMYVTPTPDVFVDPRPAIE